MPLDTREVRIRDYAFRLRDIGNNARLEFFGARWFCNVTDIFRLLDNIRFGQGAQTIRYFGREIMCIPASPRRARIAEIYLDILKVLGIILAAFLVAAVNALIAH
jgi:hypothetical protein